MALNLSFMTGLVLLWYLSPKASQFIFLASIGRVSSKMHGSSSTAKTDARSVILNSKANVPRQIVSVGPTLRGPSSESKTELSSLRQASGVFDRALLFRSHMSN